MKLKKKKVTGKHLSPFGLMLKPFFKSKIRSYSLYTFVSLNAAVACSENFFLKREF